MPKRLRSGSGHHRLEACGPSNGRHKLAYRRPNFFALLRSPSSAIDALDTLYKPNAVLSQFMGSASMAFFFVSSPCFLFLSCLFFFPLFCLFSFLFFFPIDLSLTYVCVVIGITCNI